MSNYEDLLISSRRVFTRSQPMLPKPKRPSKELMKAEVPEIIQLPSPPTPKAIARVPTSVSSHVDLLEARIRGFIKFLNSLADNDSDIWREVRAGKASPAAIIQAAAREELKK